MKTLYIVRHAKAGEHSSHDFERTLVERGRSDARAAGKKLSAQNVHPQLIVASSAARTFETAQLLAAEINYKLDLIASERRLYNAEIDKILKIVRETSNNIDELMIVGHNPGISEFADGVFGTSHQSFPTAGIAGGEINIDSWKDLNWGSGHESFFISPE